MIKLIIFDYDGLLVDSETLAYKAEKRLLSQHGHILTKQYFNKFLGISVKETLKEYIHAFNISIKIDQLYIEREKIIYELIDKNLELMPYAQDLLNFLKARNIPCAIASSNTKDYINRGLLKFNISHFFDEIITAEDVTNTKPFPDLFLKAAELMNVKNNEIIILEDADSGITAAKRANMFCIAIPSVQTNIKIDTKTCFIAPDLGIVKAFLEKLIPY